MAVANTHDVPLRLKAFTIKGAKLTVPALQDLIVCHYKQAVLWQLGQILGSADVIGNPFGLVRNVGSGIADIFYEPYRGVVQHGSKELAVGIAKVSCSCINVSVD